jgi:galactonate dehydratase
MKIARVEHLHADAGQRNFDFLKLTTDDGLVGWSEYNESFGGLGVSAVIDGLASQVIGRDPAPTRPSSPSSTRSGGRPRAA